MTLSGNNALDSILNNLDNAHIYNEFDLIDNILSNNQEKSLTILKYLRKIEVPGQDLLALLYNEIKKICSIKQT